MITPPNAGLSFHDELCARLSASAVKEFERRDIEAAKLRYVDTSLTIAATPDSVESTSGMLKAWTYPHGERIAAVLKGTSPEFPTNDGIDRLVVFTSHVIGDEHRYLTTPFPVENQRFILLVTAQNTFAVLHPDGSVHSPETQKTHESRHVHDLLLQNIYEYSGKEYEDLSKSDPIMHDIGERNGTESQNEHARERGEYPRLDYGYGYHFPVAGPRHSLPENDAAIELIDKYRETARPLTQALNDARRDSVSPYLQDFQRSEAIRLAESLSMQRDKLFLKVRIELGHIMVPERLQNAKRLHYILEFVPKIGTSEIAKMARRQDLIWCSEAQIYQAFQLARDLEIQAAA
jgi:hypothetical protein